MTKALSHDEHQHVAAGALMAREGLLPYRDFPHFHTPYLPVVYSVLYRMSDQLLWAGRLFSVLCATAMVGIVSAVAYGLFRDRGKALPWLIALGTTLLFLTSIVFINTTGRAWNQEPALLFALLAVLVQAAGLRRGSARFLFAAGILLAMAIGLRITYAPLVAPFLLAVWFFRAPFRRSIQPLLALSSGMLLGGSGMIAFFLLDPEACWFGNFEFAKVNITYRFATGEPRTMTFLKKLRFFFKLVVRPDSALFATALISVIAAYIARRTAPGTGAAAGIDSGSRSARRMECLFVALLFPFLLYGSFAPSPAFEQYFYSLVPFTILAALYALACIPSESIWLRRGLVACAVCVLFSIGFAYRGYQRFGDFFQVAEWSTSKLNRRIEDIRALVPKGRVLTLAPLYPLEAGLTIYPSLNNGPFAWRVSSFVDPEKAARIDMVTVLTLAATLEKSPPDAILVGYEKVGEKMFVDYAMSHGFQMHPLAGETRVWTRPR